MNCGVKIPPNKVSAHHLNNRFRLGAKSVDEDGLILKMQKQKTILRI
ncbi:hypothetical protein ACFPYN_10510 [Paenisporosarcina macmurdoensis]|uniref:HNH endonuclease n=1 Tax=Paenisporosarcina macmurdoensis TaxID=212659 RepID=A0ABW1L8S1_9BACL